MIGLIALGAGAGLVSALLFASVSTGSLAAVMLMYMAPLPILIVGLGWHHLVALLALACGGLTASILIRPGAGVAFALGPALAAWALAWLASNLPVLGALAARLGGRLGHGWSPAGLLLFAVGTFGAVVAFSALGAATDFDHARYLQALNQAASAVLRREYGAGARLEAPANAASGAAELIRLVVSLAPALLAALLTLVLAANLWLAGKAVAISGRMIGSWPDIPSTRMPPGAIAVLGLGCLLAALSGFASVAGMTLVGGMAMAFALQGLALMHDISRHRPARGLLLSTAYLLVLLLGYLLLPMFAVLGLVDSASSRLRRLARPAPPST